MSGLEHLDRLGRHEDPEAGDDQADQHDDRQHERDDDERSHAGSLAAPPPRRHGPIVLPLAWCRRCARAVPIDLAHPLELADDWADPAAAALLHEHGAGQHHPIRRDGCPICLALPPAPILPRRDPEPWIEQLRRWRRS